MPATSRSRRWILATAASAFLCVLLFAYLNRDGCWLFWHGYGAFTMLIFPLVWFSLLFGLARTGRIVLIVASFALVFFWPVVDSLPAAAAHARAVGALRGFQGALEEQKRTRGVYPETVPSVSTKVDEHFYEFHYTPVRKNGKITDYMMEATLTPQSRFCGCGMSFVADSKGTIHYTIENRSATTADKLLE